MDSSKIHHGRLAEYHPDEDAPTNAADITDVSSALVQGGLYNVPPPVGHSASTQLRRVGVYEYDESKGLPPAVKYPKVTEAWC